MAAKLELRFTGAGSNGQTISLKDGTLYMFRVKRNGSYQVQLGSTPFETAQNFYDAFQADDNVLGVFTTSYRSTQLAANGTTIVGDPHGIVEIEHPDNTYFDGLIDNADFITATVTTTTQTTENSITPVVSAADADPCGNYKLTISTNTTNLMVHVESPVGVKIHEYLTNSVTPEVLTIPRRSVSTTSVVKLYRSSFANTLDREVLFVAPPVLSITDVSLEGSPFGAIATINTNQGNTKTYSLDNVNFQGSNVFAGLLAGSYTAYVSDSYGCTKSKTFVVTEEMVQGLTAEPFIRVPIHNSIRFAQRTGNNFLSHLSTENDGYIKINQYYQEYLKGDAVRTQFKSSYTDNKVFLIDSTGAETPISIIKKSNNINRTNIYEGNYTEKEGRIAVYFTSGNIYNADGSVADEGHLLNGRLPLWYEEGVYLSIEGIGVTRIDKVFLDTDGVEYAVTTKDAAGTVLSKKITSIHTAHPYEVYEFEITFPDTGLFQIRLEYGTEFYLSEIIRINEELPENYLKVEWWNKRNNDILYNTGIRHYRRLGWEQYFTYLGKTEKEVYDTDTTVELINSKSFAVYELSFEDMPMELYRGLHYGFDNSSTIVINGAVFVSETPVKVESGGQWYGMKAELTLVDQTMNGQQEIVDVVSAEFLNVETENNVSFLRL